MAPCWVWRGSTVTPSLGGLDGSGWPIFLQLLGWRSCSLWLAVIKGQDEERRGHTGSCNELNGSKCKVQAKVKPLAAVRAADAVLGPPNHPDLYWWGSAIVQGRMRELWEETQRLNTILNVNVAHSPKKISNFSLPATPMQYFRWSHRQQAHCRSRMDLGASQTSFRRHLVWTKYCRQHLGLQTHLAEDHPKPLIRISLPDLASVL